jgi:hypothetical protein
VANTTLAFFFRKVLSHSRSWAAKSRAVEDQPAFVDDDERGRAVQPAFDPVEQVGQDGGGRSAADQAFGLERLHRRFAEPLGLRIEQPAPRPAEAVGGERLFELLALEQHGEPGQCALANRRARK